MKLPTLKSFLKSGARNAWVVHSGFDSLYVRRTERFGFPTLDVANVEAVEPGKGAFTRLVQQARNKYRLGVYVESVLNNRFGEKLLRMGFECTQEGLPPGGLGACYFLSPLKELK